MKIFCIFFVADPGFEPGQSNYCLGVMGPTFYHYTNPQCYLLRRVGFEPTTSGLWDQRATRLLYPAMFGYDGRSRTSISYWTTFMKNNLPLPPFDIISWRKYTTSLSHHSIHLSVMFVNIKQDSKKVIKLTVWAFAFIVAVWIFKTNKHITKP